MSKRTVVQNLLKGKTTAAQGSWLRLYDDALDDPKVQTLDAWTFRGWINVLMLANKRRGVLPEVADIAFRLRISVNDAETLVAHLIGAGLIEWTQHEGDRVLMPHNWTSRQWVSSSTQRMRKLRARRKMGDGGVTSHVTYGDAESDECALSESVSSVEYSSNVEDVAPSLSIQEGISTSLCGTDAREVRS